MENKHIRFTKYEEMGAYHWIQCDRNSSNYNPPLDARYQIILNNISSSNTVLDIGCGDGYLMSLLSNFNDNVYGIDYERTAIKIARNKLCNFHNCTVLQASCYETPFPDSYFDLIILSDVIEHLSFPTDCINEISRILKPAGTLLITTPKWRQDRMWDEVHFKEYTSLELENMLLPSFNNIKINYFWPLFWSNLYSTRIGWKLLKSLTRYFYNPFLRHGLNESKYGQILALCSNTIKK